MGAPGPASSQLLRRGGCHRGARIHRSRRPRRSLASARRSCLDA